MTGSAVLRKAWSGICYLWNSVRDFLSDVQDLAEKAPPIFSEDELEFDPFLEERRKLHSLG